MSDNQVNVLVPNQQYRNQIETYQIGNPTSLPLLVEALRQYVLSLPVEPDKGLAEKVANLETQMTTVKENISSIQNNVSDLTQDIANIEGDVGSVDSLATNSKTVVPAINELNTTLLASVGGGAAKIRYYERVYESITLDGSPYSGKTKVVGFRYQEDDSNYFVIGTVISATDPTVISNYLQSSKIILFKQLKSWNRGWVSIN